MYAEASLVLPEIITAQKSGQSAGIFSVCSAHPGVLEACLSYALDHRQPLLIEATCNQVNQFGGYTGNTPAQFTAAVRALAAQIGFSPQQILFGGDHLGPNPWRTEAAASAMHKACQMVDAYVRAGFSKIHLDASMPCAGDTLPLHPEEVARRAAQLCQTAEQAHQTQASLQPGLLPPVYIIGTEVPVPGGASGAPHPLCVTAAEAALQSIETFRRAFYTAGLSAAWQRVVALVVQPGVEFDHAQVFPYNSQKAATLSRAIESQPGLVYEAHSTDFQTPSALRRMVEDHFAILKVGPALTFAYREALFALADIEQAWLASSGSVSRLSHLPEVLERVMLANPRDWQAYYLGDAPQQAYARRYSFSDRIRYYWHYPEVQDAVQTLLHNLSRGPLPLPLLSQYFSKEFPLIQEGSLANQPQALITAHIQQVVQTYAAACEKRPAPSLLTQSGLKHSSTCQFEPQPA